jgi:hypothetical protein
MEHPIITDWAQSMAIVPGVLPSLAPATLRRPSLEYGCVDWFDYPSPQDVRRPEAQEDLLDA